MEEENLVWKTLFKRQFRLIKPRVSQQFLVGMRKLQLDPHTKPEMDKVSMRIKRFSGWSLVSAENEYLNAREWFTHIAKKRFPVTDYIRKIEDLEFTPLPDLFHEYFGHLAFFTDPIFADIAHQFGLVAEKFRLNDQQMLELQRLWWYSIEFGFILEKEEIKVLGAGLISSPGEFLNSISTHVEIVPFKWQEVIKTPIAVNQFHSKYFVIENEQQIIKELNKYVRSFSKQNHKRI